MVAVDPAGRYLYTGFKADILPGIRMDRDVGLDREAAGRRGGTACSTWCSAMTCAARSSIFAGSTRARGRTAGGWSWRPTAARSLTCRATATPIGYTRSPRCARRSGQEAHRLPAPRLSARLVLSPQRIPGGRVQPGKRLALRPDVGQGNDRAADAGPPGHARRAGRPLHTRRAPPAGRVRRPQGKTRPDELRPAALARGALGRGRARASPGVGAARAENAGAGAGPRCRWRRSRPWPGARTVSSRPRRSPPAIRKRWCSSRARPARAPGS